MRISSKKKNSLALFRVYLIHVQGYEHRLFSIKIERHKYILYVHTVRISECNCPNSDLSETHELKKKLLEKPRFLDNFFSFSAEIELKLRCKCYKKRINVNIHTISNNDLLQ